jgi:hypothetical protein
MARPTREQVFSALFSLLNQNIAGVKTYSRRFAQPSTVRQTIGTPPVLMLLEMPEQTLQKGPNQPSQKVWNALIVVVFFNASQPNPQDPGLATPGATIINPILDSIDAALFPSPAAGVQFTQTLGGLVQGIWIDGETHKETGDTDPQGMGGAVVPLKIIVP